MTEQTNCYIKQSPASQNDSKQCNISLLTDRHWITKHTTIILLLLQRPATVTVQTRKELNYISSTTAH